MFPTRKQFVKWSIDKKWGFVASVIGIASTPLFLALYFVPWQPSDAKDFDASGSVSIGGPGDLRAALQPASFDAATPSLSFSEWKKAADQHAQANSQHFDEILTNIRESNAAELDKICKFKIGIGDDPSDNLAVFFQRYNGLGSPRLGDALVRSMENKFVDWPARFVDVVMDAGAVWIVFEAADDPCPEGGCPSSAVVRAAARYDGLNEFVAAAKPGDHFRLKGIVRLMDEPQNSHLPLIARMIIDPLSTDYRSAKIEECDA